MSSLQILCLCYCYTISATIFLYDTLYHRLYNQIRISFNTRTSLCNNLMSDVFFVEYLTFI